MIEVDNLTGSLLPATTGVLVFAAGGGSKPCSFG
jgi:hypothetical protein